MQIGQIKLSERIYLQPDIDGHVVLRINDVLYEADDIVPPSHFPEMAKEKKRDARTVAKKCLIHEYGPNRRRWPVLGRSFVEEQYTSNETPSQQ